MWAIHNLITGRLEDLRHCLVLEGEVFEQKSDTIKLLFGRIVLVAACGSVENADRRAFSFCDGKLYTSDQAGKNTKHFP